MWRYDGRTMRGAPPPQSDAIARYLVLVDISGYTGFLGGVEETHGEDFSAGLPAGYRVLGELIQGVVDGLSPGFEIVKVEGDAVFGTAPAQKLDGRGAAVIEQLGQVYRTFLERRDALATSASDDKCMACFGAGRLDLKVVIHRGLAVRQPIGGVADLLGPAVNVAHRLLKNTVRDRIGYRPYVLITQPAASNLGQPEVGLAHRETYPDVGSIEVRILDLAEVAGIVPRSWPVPPSGSEAWPELRISR
jgi:class 3 adenylate cyclase